MRSNLTKACNELFSSGKFSDLNIPAGLFAEEYINLNKFDYHNLTEINNGKRPSIEKKVKNMKEIFKIISQNQDPILLNYA